MAQPVIAARILKAENNIPDAPNEIELTIKDIETFVSRTEERNENFSEEDSAPVRKTKIQEEDKDQLSMFS